MVKFKRSRKLSSYNALVFDWGTGVIGILDLRDDSYKPYEGAIRMRAAAELLIAFSGTIVSFNGNLKDLDEIAKILSLKDKGDLKIIGTHEDMLEVCSDIRWPPRPGGNSILGPSLRDHYKHFCNMLVEAPPADINSDYVESNWRDCYMTAELWKMWKEGLLQRK